MAIRAILVHGFNVSDGGQGSVGMLEPFLAAQGIVPHRLNYTHFGFLEARLRNAKVAQTVSRIAYNLKLRGDTVMAFGHSNGAAILHLATTHYDAKIDHLVYVNPALQRELAPGRHVKSCDVWHSPSDMPVAIAEFIRKLTFSAINSRPWGDMGAFGYVGEDKRMRNFNKESDYLVSSEGHSDVWQLDKLAYFGPEMIWQAKAAMEHAGLGMVKSEEGLVAEPV